jgi:oxygen-independent coproporphyrinogen-3 oxidase
MAPGHLYIHVPFCARRCSYCDFSIAVRGRTPVDEYVSALKAELSLGAIQESTLDTVYLGGGTPSRLGGGGIAEVLAAVRNHAKIASNAEITIEANPDDVNDIVVAQWVSAGVNRVSLGAQSFDDTVLEWMHRTHDSRQVGRGVETIRGGGIENISLDLIFALPAHLNRNWTEDVQRVLDLDPSHVSLYGLTVEAHTPIARWADRGAIVEGSEAQYEEEFLYAHEAMSAAGLDHYEVSNFARRDKASRHNSVYWTGAPYAAVGPSAHSFDGAVRRWNVAAYAEWARRLGDQKSIVAGEESLTTENRDAEDVYLGLRTSRGLAIDESDVALAEPWGNAGWAEVDQMTPESDAKSLSGIEKGESTGNGRDDAARGFRMRLTPTGWLRLDSIAAILAASRSSRANAALIASPSHCYI